MRSIAHISDLHFGAADPRMVARLASRLVELRPDLLVVSGDLTQRARPAEFLQARAFLDSIPAPRIAIPGNHDIALYNLYSRFVEKLRNYRRYICEDVEPFYADTEMMVVSVNTARSWTFKGGRINPAQVARIRERLLSATPAAVKIVVAHHPLDLPALNPPEAQSRAVAGRARFALRALADCGIDLLLSGHLHISRFAAPAERLRIGGHTMVLAQAGTAVSTRIRGEGQSFNIIHAAAGWMVIEQRCWAEATGDYEARVRARYERTPAGWMPCG